MPNNQIDDTVVLSQSKILIEVNCPMKNRRFMHNVSSVSYVIKSVHLLLTRYSNKFIFHRKQEQRITPSNIFSRKSPLPLSGLFLQTH